MIICVWETWKPSNVESSTGLSQGASLSIKQYTYPSQSEEHVDEAKFFSERFELYSDL